MHLSYSHAQTPFHKIKSLFSIDKHISMCVSERMALAPRVVSTTPASLLPPAAEVDEEMNQEVPSETFNQLRVSSSNSSSSSLASSYPHRNRATSSCSSLLLQETNANVTNLQVSAEC